MEITEPKVRSTTTESDALFPVRVEQEFFLHVAHFFFNLLVNRSMLDFVLDPGKRSLRSRRPSNNRE